MTPDNFNTKKISENYFKKIIQGHSCKNTYSLFFSKKTCPVYT